MKRKCSGGNCPYDFSIQIGSPPATTDSYLSRLKPPSCQQLPPQFRQWQSRNRSTSESEEPSGCGLDSSGCSLATTPSPDLADVPYPWLSCAHGTSGGEVNRCSSVLVKLFLYTPIWNMWSALCSLVSIGCYSNAVTVVTLLSPHVANVVVVSGSFHSRED